MFKNFFLIVPISLLLFQCTQKKQPDNTLIIGALLLSAKNPTLTPINDTPTTATNDTPTIPTNDTPKAKAIREYNSSYLGSTVINSGWTGSVSGCKPGSTSAEANEKTLMRVNYFRALVGLPPVSFDSSTNVYTQNAALMMKANNTLSHNPPTTWTCYTNEGAVGAAKSNLATIHSSAAVTGYIHDDGAHNFSVGHRRWIFYSKLQTIGSGNTDTTNALWVIGNFLSSYPSNLPQFIAYPPKGYIPRQLVFPRWSFSIPDANFSNANISMTGPDGKSIALTKENYAVGCGDNTIVWVPSGINTQSKEDQKYTVNISNVIVKGENKSYNYEVIIMDPGESGPATTVPNITWDSNGYVNYYQAEGQKFTYDCPAGGTAKLVFGTDVYSILSSVCTAAVHAGKITLASGGKVTFVIRPSASSYKGSTRNGITSYDLNSSNYGSFAFP